MEVKELICIGCPLGCNLKVEISDNAEMKVSGNNCPRGGIYAKKELTNPTRVVTSTVKVENAAIAAVSVRTESDIPKSKIQECVAALKNVELQAPVKIGDIVIENACGTGVNVIATKNVNRYNN